VADFYEHDNESLGSIMKVGYIYDKLRDSQVFK
jgi:hypothetical protein